jgi:hypothetical protein
MRAPRIFAVTAIALLLGCRGTAPLPSGEGGPGEPIQVIVTNHNWATVEVFAVAAGVSRWIGMVETTRTETFTLPEEHVGWLDFHLAVHPIGSRVGYATDAIVLSGDAMIELIVENNLALSHYRLRDR